MHVHVLVCSYVHSPVPVHRHICFCVFVFICVQLCACVGKKTNFYSLGAPHPPWFETGSFTALIFAKWSKLADQQTLWAASIHLPSTGIMRLSYHFQPFFPKWVLGIDSGLVLGVYWLSYFPSCIQSSSDSQLHSFSPDLESVDIFTEDWYYKAEL